MLSSGAKNSCKLHTELHNEYLLALRDATGSLHAARSPVIGPLLRPPHAKNRNVAVFAADSDAQFVSVSHTVLLPYVPTIFSFGHVRADLNRNF